MKNLAWAVGALIVVIVSIFLFASNTNQENDTLIPSPNLASSPDLNMNLADATKSAVELPFPLLSGKDINGKKARIKTKKGDIVFELLSQAPLASSNFIQLSNKRFYDGLIFHRVEKGFVIQGGDPKGDGTGGPGYVFGDEEVFGNYVRGTVAMANAGPNTNGSQFFIALVNLSNLPKKYTIFGKVIEGMDVVENIQVGDVMQSIMIE